jgi:hypothetical protein
VSEGPTPRICDWFKCSLADASFVAVTGLIGFTWTGSPLRAAGRGLFPSSACQCTSRCDAEDVCRYVTIRGELLSSRNTRRKALLGGPTFILDSSR